MTKTITLATAIALLGAPAMAQELTFGAGSIDLGYVDADGTELNSVIAEGDVEFTYDQFLFGASTKYNSLEQGGGELVVKSYEGFAGFMPTSELLFGAGLTALNIDGNEDYNGYEAFGQYDNGTLGFAVAYEKPLGNDEDFAITNVYGSAALSDEITVNGVVESVSELSETLYYLSAEYDAGPVFLRGYYNGVTEADAAIYGARASLGLDPSVFGVDSWAFSLDPSFFLTADFQRIEGFFGGETDTYSIGGGYHINDTVMIDASVGQLSDTDTSATTFRIGLNFETGGRKRLDTRLSDAIRADFANGVSLIAPDLGFGNGINFY